MLGLEPDTTSEHAASTTQEDAVLQKARENAEMDAVVQQAFAKTDIVFVPIKIPSYNADRIRLLNSSVDFVTLNEPVVSVGSSQAPETLYFDPRSQALEAYYRQFLSWLGKNNFKVHPDDYAHLIFDMINFISQDQRGAASQLKTSLSAESAPQHLVRPKQAVTGHIVTTEDLETALAQMATDDSVVTPVVPLEQFIKHKKTLDHALAILSAYLMSRLLKEGLLPAGEIYTQRAQLSSINTWAVFNPKNTTALYLIDAMAGVIVNLTSPAGLNRLGNTICTPQDLQDCRDRAGKQVQPLSDKPNFDMLGLFPSPREYNTEFPAPAFYAYRPLFGDQLGHNARRYKSTRVCRLIDDNFNFVGAKQGKYLFSPGFVGVRSQDEESSRLAALNEMPHEKPSRLATLDINPITPVEETALSVAINEFFQRVNACLPDQSLRTRLSCFGQNFAIYRPVSSVGVTGTLNTPGINYDGQEISLTGDCALFSAYLLTAYLHSNKVPVKGVFLHKQIEDAPMTVNVSTTDTPQQKQIMLAEMTYWLEVVTPDNSRYFIGSGGIYHQSAGFFTSEGPTVLSQAEYEEKFGLLATLSAPSDEATAFSAAASSTASEATTSAPSTDADAHSSSPRRHSLWAPASPLPLPYPPPQQPSTDPSSSP